MSRQTLHVQIAASAANSPAARSQQTMATNSPWTDGGDTLGPLPGQFGRGDRGVGMPSSGAGDVGVSSRGRVAPVSNLDTDSDSKSASGADAQRTSSFNTGDGDSRAGSLATTATGASGVQRAALRSGASSRANPSSVAKSQAAKQALEPLSVARMSCNMHPIDLIGSIGVLLRVVGASSTDVEAVYVGAPPGRVKPYHLQQYYGHKSPILAVDHVGTSAVVSASATAVFCHELRSGETRWSYFLTSLTFVEVVASHNLVIIGGVKLGRLEAFLSHRRTDLVAIDLRTGQPAWTSPLKGGALVMKTCTRAGLVLLGMENGGLEAHSLKTGERLWSAKVSAAGACITALTVDNKCKTVFAASHDVKRVVAISLANPNKPEQLWAAELHEVWRSADDFVARLFVGARHRTEDSVQLPRSVVVITSNGMAFRLSCDSGSLLGVQHSYGVPNLCDMIESQPGFAALHLDDMSLGLWAVSSQSNPPLWSFPLRDLMHIDVRFVQAFPSPHGPLVCVGSSAGQTFIVDAADGAVKTFVPVLHIRDALHFVFSLLPPSVKGCDCGCGAAIPPHTAGPLHRFASASSTMLAGGGVKSPSLRPPCPPHHGRSLLELDDEGNVRHVKRAEKIPVVLVTDMGRITLRRPEDSRSGPGHLAARAPPDILCAAVHGSVSRDVKDTRLSTVFTGHPRSVMRWDLYTPNTLAHDSNHLVDFPVWEVATSGTVESIDVCEEENLVIAVVTHAYVDAAGETQSIQGGATAAGAGGNGSDSDDDVVMVTTLSGLGVDSPRTGAQTQRQPERTGIDHVAAFSIKTGKVVWTTRKTDEDAAGETKRSNSRGHGDTDAAAVDLDSVDVDITATCVCSATGRIAVGSAIGTLQYLVTRTGEVRWTVQASESRISSVVQASTHGLVVTGDVGGAIRAFRASNGEVAWVGGSSAATNPVLSLGLAQPSGIVVSLTMDNTTRGSSLKDGTLLWIHHQQDESDPVQELLVTPEDVFIRSQHTITCCGVEKGQQRWVYDPPFGEIRAMAANHGSSASPTRIVVGAGSGRVEELNVKARQQWWEVEETRTIVSSEVDSRLDVVLDSYGSRLAFVWDLVILLVELLQWVALPYSADALAVSSSLQWMQDNVLWPTATLGLASDQLRVSVSHALIVAWVMTGALFLVALALPRLEMRVFTSGQHSGWRFLWLVLLMALQVATRLCVLPVTLLLAQPFVCRDGVSGTWVVEADPAVECFSDSTHWAYVVASIVSFLVFLSIAMYTANVPGRWDLPDTSHRRTSRIGLFARLGPRDKAHALSQASALHAALTVVAKATVGITSLVFAKAAAGSSLQAVGAWVMVALCIAWVVSTVWLRPMMSWHSQTVIVALQCAIVWVFTAGALWHSCVALDDASDACEPGFGTPGAFSWAALVFGIAVFIQAVPWPRCETDHPNAVLVYTSSGGSPARRKARRPSHYAGGNTHLSREQAQAALMSSRDNVDTSNRWRRGQRVVRVVSSEGDGEPSVPQSNGWTGAVDV